MNWWQWLLLGAGIGAAWFIIACAFAWLICRPFKRPAPGSGAFPPARVAAAPVRPLVPGLHIPPPPATHHCGGVARLIDIRAGGCIYVWRPSTGWVQPSSCDIDWDAFLASLPTEGT